MKTFAFIFARGGSKGVPGKNIREMAGKPLLAYSIDMAHEIEPVDKVFVSTDDPAIATIARNYGANVIDRPEELAQDDTPEWLAWQHAVKWIQEQNERFDVFLSLPTTSPLRKKDDVLKCLNKLDERFDVVVTITETNRSPWFNMVKMNDVGSLRLLVEGKKHYMRRQDAPKTFDMTTVTYVTRPNFILNNQKIWDGKVAGVLIPLERAVDIDDELDFEIAEFLLQREAVTNKAGFHAK
tara:strand:+ start:634 stop:1350 length:717 start_codon:yes stop_codon:yes gene_type:complete